LEIERAKIAGKLTTRVTAEQMQMVTEFAEEVRKRLPYADEHFAERRRLIETLDVRATLEWEGEEWAINADCWLGKARLRTNTPPRRALRVPITTPSSLASPVTPSQRRFCLTSGA